MSSNSLLVGFSSRPPVASKNLLDRAEWEGPNRPILSEAQSKTDQLVGGFIRQACDYKTLIAMAGAGAAYRFARLGVFSEAAPLLSRGGAWAPALLRAGSWAPALAAESATFTALNHGLAGSEGPAFARNFGKDWATAAITLGSLKFFGSLAAGENLISQHLLASGGMVAGHQGASVLGLVAKPEGDIFTQLIHAEATNLQMLGGMALLHGASPRLGAMERSVEILLQSQDSALGGRARPFPSLLLEAYAGPGGVNASGEGRAKTTTPDFLNLMMSNGSDADLVNDIPRLKELAVNGDQSALTNLIKAQKTHPEAEAAVAEVIEARRARKHSDRIRIPNTPPSGKGESASDSPYYARPFSFRKLFALLIRNNVKNGFDLIELCHDGDKSLEVRRAAQHIQSTFSDVDKRVIYTMVEALPGIEQRLRFNNPDLTESQARVITEDHLAILTADELSTRGSLIAKESLIEYDLRNLANLAKIEPHAVGLLRILIKYKNGAALRILQELDPNHLMELALRRHPQALPALAYLATLKNEKARQALINPTMIDLMQNSRQSESEIE